jgi:hypothetical protein
MLQLPQFSQLFVPDLGWSQGNLGEKTGGFPGSSTHHGGAFAESQGPVPWPSGPVNMGNFYFLGTRISLHLEMNMRFAQPRAPFSCLFDTWSKRWKVLQKIIVGPHFRWNFVTLHPLEELFISSFPRILPRKSMKTTGCGTQINMFLNSHVVFAYISYLSVASTSSVVTYTHRDGYKYTIYIKYCKFDLL